MRTPGLAQCRSLSEATEENLIFPEDFETYRWPYLSSASSKGSPSWISVRALVSETYSLWPPQGQQVSSQGLDARVRVSQGPESLIVETIYKGKIRPYGTTKGSLTEVPIAKGLSDDLTAWRRTSQEQYDSKRTSIAWRHRMRRRFCFRIGRRLHRPEQLSQTGPAQAGNGARSAEAHVPGHSAHDRDAGPKEGDSQGRARDDAALPRGDDQ